MRSEKERGQPPQPLAAERGYVQAVKLLLAQGTVDINSKDSDGRTLLSHAAEEGEEVVVKLLLAEDDIDTDSKDRSGRTPLSYASERGHEAIVELLLRHNEAMTISKENTMRPPLSFTPMDKCESSLKPPLTQEEFSRTRPYLCPHCRRLTLKRLYLLAEAEESEAREMRLNRFPEVMPEKYFCHHPTWESLEKSAIRGCAICAAIHYAVVLSSRYGNPNFPKMFYQGSLFGGIKRDIEKSKNTDLRLWLSRTKKSDTGPTGPLYAVLLVQVGSTIIHRIGYRLFKERDKYSLLDTLRIGRNALDWKLGSDANFGLAQEWLNDCRTHHDRDACAINEMVPLPTRLIDTGLQNDQQSPRLVLTKGRYGSYATLSHCWGGISQCATTRKNLDDHCSRIDMQELPANFRDAILIAQRLGFQYLWIDSMCIIQDSVEDWDRESAVMGNIYRQSALTIAADAGSHSNYGMLQDNVSGPYGDEHEDLRIPWTSTSEENVLIRPFEKYEDFFELLYESSLASRGWALQERLLSYRTIHYGRMQLFWECQCARLSADGMSDPVSGVGWTAHFPNLLSSNFLGFSREAMFKNWYEILGMYLEDRSLTVESDLLPALAGMAAQFQVLTGCTYVAGLWLEDIHRGLLWKCNPRSEAILRMRPSWTWARFRNGAIYEVLDRKISPADAVIQNCQVETLGSNPMGEVKFGQVVIRGLCRSILRSRQKYSKNEERYCGKKEDWVWAANQSEIPTWLGDGYANFDATEEVAYVRHGDCSDIAGDENSDPEEPPFLLSASNSNCYTFIFITGLLSPREESESDDPIEENFSGLQDDPYMEDEGGKKELQPEEDEDEDKEPPLRPNFFNVPAQNVSQSEEQTRNPVGENSAKEVSDAEAFAKSFSEIRSKSTRSKGSSEEKGTLIWHCLILSSTGTVGEYLRAGLIEIRDGSWLIENEWKEWMETTVTVI